MSEKLGHITFEKERRSMFLDVAPGFPSRDYSDETAREIDNEIRRIIENTYNLVKSTLTAHRSPRENCKDAFGEGESRRRGAEADHKGRQGRT